jgi:hypothetical protein
MHLNLYSMHLLNMVLNTLRLVEFFGVQMSEKKGYLPYFQIMMAGKVEPVILMPLKQLKSLLCIMVPNN